MAIASIFIEHYINSKCCNSPLVGRRYRAEKFGDKDKVEYTCSKCKQPVENPNPDEV